MRKQSFVNAMLNIAVGAFALAANAANMSYTPSGTPPYLWSNATAWGGALPTADDNATVSQTALKTNPLFVRPGDNAVSSNLVIGNGTIYVEPEASLTVKKGASGGITIANAKNTVGVITNYGTITAYNFDFGSKTKANLARFDNFGTLNVERAVRLQLDGGTPSIFHNHEGATLRKTGGNEYTFYLGHTSSAGGYSTLINEGDIFDNTTEIWAGLNSSAKCDIIINKSGRFFTEKSIVLGCVANTLCVLTMNDHGYCSGKAQWVLGGRTKAAAGDNATGQIVMNDNSTLAASNTMYVGYCQNGRGFITLNDSAKMTSTSAFHLGYGASATGTMTMGGDSSFSNSGEFNLGYGSGATGSLTLTNSATAEVGGKAYIGRGSNATGNMTLADSAMVTFKNDLHVGYSTGATGNISLTNSAVLCVEDEVFVGDNATASGNILLTGDSRMYVTNVAMLVGYNNGATGTVTITENAQLHAPWLAIGQTSVANTTGYLKLCDNAMLVSTNICIPRWGSQGWGTLEVGGNSVVTNVHILRVAYDANSTVGVGQSGTVAMRGGSMFFTIDLANSNYVDKGFYNPIALNGYISTARGRIRGWGKIAFSDPRKYVTEAVNTKGEATPSGIVHYGQVIADGEGEERDLDFGRFGAMNYSNTYANPSGTNGWFAVNKGRLKLPRSLPRKDASYRCVGDHWPLDYSSGTSGANRLANTFTTVFTGAALNNFIFAELYATDRSDIPAGLDGVGADKVVSVWRAGLFDDGPEADEPTHPSSFTSAKVHFKYPNVGDDLDGMTTVCVYRHDGTAGGKWRLAGRANPSTKLPVVEANVSGPSSANWNMGWFAIVARAKPFGAVLSIK